MTTPNDTGPGRTARFQAVAADLFAGCPSQAAPVAVIVVDSPGVDAGQRVRQITDLLASQGGRPAVLSDQALESHNPRAFAAVLRGEPQPPDVAETTRWMHDWSRDWAQAYRVNVVVKIPAERASDVLAHAAAYRAAGYRTAMSIPVAAHPVRWWGQIERYTAALATRLAAPPRAPVLSDRDAHTAGLAHIAEHLDRHTGEDRAVDLVEVLRPGRPTVRVALSDAAAAQMRDPAAWTARRGRIAQAVHRELRGPVASRVARLVAARLPKLQEITGQLLAGRDTVLRAVRRQINQVAQALPRPALNPQTAAVGRAPVVRLAPLPHRQPGGPERT